ncbi:MAG: anthranilate phosphoribosyltransferase [Acidobacteriota bacterium]
MLPELTRKLMAGQDLAQPEAEQALESILSEETPEAAIASFLTALAIKGETSEEIAGFARIMRRHARRIKSDHSRVIDTAGTGGGADTFNISTAAAFVIAGAGLPVAKHGNRALTSRCGSADVLAALGVNIENPPEVAEEALNEIGIAFMFAPLFHPAMKRVAQVRRQLGHRTIFNMLGPLTNPASAPYQIIGVYSTELTEKLARALCSLDCRRAWVVHSHDGLDELSISAPTSVADVCNSSVRSFDFEATDFTDYTEKIRENPCNPWLNGGTPEENAAIIRGILEGRINGAAREIVILNAGAALHVAGEDDFPQALTLASDSIDSGAALDKLQQLIRIYSRNLRDSLA